MQRKKYVGATLAKALEMASAGLQAGAMSAEITAQHGLDARTGQAVIVGYGVVVEAEDAPASGNQGNQGGGCSCRS